MKKRKFTDSIIGIYLISFIFLVVGSFLTEAIILLLNLNLDDYKTYYPFIGAFILILLIIALVKRNKYMVKKLKLNIKHILLGLVIGALLNLICAFAAMLNKDLVIGPGTYGILFVVISFILVFIQSSTEELFCRLFMYQRLKETHKKPWVIIIASSLFFGILHLGNPGVTIISFLTLILYGVFLAMLMYYFDSIWLVCGIHTAWNFTQNIILGLPNSGQEASQSIFAVINAKNSFFYSTTFGIEGSILSVIILTVSCVAVYIMCKNKKLSKR